uniref:UBX domain-containing protein n=1 Tax=Leersia perrieri TaxID=77586 RepID=A0A0D9VGE6_9ORYZ
MPGLSSNSSAAAARTETETEMEQLTARFVDAVTMHGANQQDGAATPHAVEEACVVVAMDDLVARFGDVAVSDGPARGEAPCVVRVRLPDGQTFDRVFGATRPVTALFRYCGAAVAACGMAGRPFRLLRFAGAASYEIPPRGDASLQDLGLGHCIVYIVLSP